MFWLFYEFQRLIYTGVRSRWPTFNQWDHVGNIDPFQNSRRDFFALKTLDAKQSLGVEGNRQVAKTAQKTVLRFHYILQTQCGGNVHPEILNYWAGPEEKSTTWPQPLKHSAEEDGPFLCNLAGVRWKWWNILSWVLLSLDEITEGFIMRLWRVCLVISISPKQLGICG